MRLNSGVSNSFRRTNRPNSEQQDADEEGAAPAPGEERLVRQQARQQRDRAGAETQAEREADLREAGVEAAAIVRRVFEGHQHRAAPLAAHGEALHQAQHHQQQRRGDADLGVGRHQADQERYSPHHRQGQNEQRLAADAVAEMAEEGAADRAGDEAHRERRIGQQQRYQRVAGGKEQLVEDQAG